MSGTTVEQALVMVARILQPLGTAISSPANLEKFLRSFGFSLTPERATDTLAGLGDGRDALGELAKAVRDLALVAEQRTLAAEDLVPVVEKVPGAIAVASALPKALTSLADRLPANFVGEIFDLLVATYLTMYHDTLHRLAVLIGIIDYRPISAGQPDARDVDYVRVTVRWEQLARMLWDPAGLVREEYGWTTPDFAPNLLLVRSQSVAEALGLEATVESLEGGLTALLWPAGAPEDPPLALQVPVWTAGDDQASAAVGLLLAGAGPTTSPDGPDAGLALMPFVDGKVEAAIPLGEAVVLEVLAAASMSGGPVLVVRPGAFQLTSTGPLPSPDTRLGLRLRRLPAPGEDRIVLLAAEGLGVDAEDVFVELASTLEAVELAVGVRGGSIGVKPVGDGFLAHVIPPEGLVAPFDLVIGWSSSAGLRIHGGAGLEATFQVGAELGPLVIESVYLAVRAGEDSIAVVAATSPSLILGPFVAAVSRLGVRLDLTFPQGGGNLGPAQLAVAFNPPTGVGLAIDTPAVSGGGFLELDYDAGRYAGVFELTIVDTVSVKVIGIITTKLPDGRPGFALLLIITADGFTPVQLGMGFVLTGIGGLIALNRTIDVEAVRAGLSSGVLDSVLFAKDPVRNANRIIATLDQIFPLASDRLLIGPLAEIGWGSPPVVKLRLALLLEIPQPLRAVLLAALAIVLPDEDQPVVELHVDAVGVLDLARGELALDASLHHSRLWKFALTGDMALRLNWGSDPQFLISVGGFHPRFPPPAGLRRLDRLAFSLSDSENPRVRLETYLAVTSNTIQMGARVSLRAEAGGFGIDGGGAFDALVQWVPFGIDVGFEAWVRIFGPTGTLLAARVAVQITGPQPWHVAGVASVQLLWFSIQVNVDFTIGDPQPPPALETVDVAGLLWQELSRPASWSAALAVGVRPGVTLSTANDGPDEQALVVHPLAMVSVRQKVAPLGTTISRVGALRPRDGTRRYELDVQAPAGIRVQVLTDHFAVAQYQDLSDDDKLRQPAFSRLPAGVSLVPDAATAVPLQRAVSVGLGFETLDLAAFDTPAVPAGGEPAPAAPALLGGDVERLLPRQRAGLQVVPA
jgi:hypothetical protein